MKDVSPPPTMQDVARAAGVHQTTVSRVLRNDPRITAEVQQRVRAAAEAVGYVPNPLLSALGTLRRQRAAAANQMALAYVLRADATHRTVGAHVAGAREAAARRGYKLEEFVLDDDLREERLNQILTARNILGVILGPLPEAHGHFTLDWTQFCAVAIEYSFSEPAFDRVVTDSYATMNTVLAQCLRRGLGRVGIVLAQVVDERNEGLLCAAHALAVRRERKLANLPPLILPEWNADVFENWMHKARPRVIVSSNTFLPQIEVWLRKSKLRVPRDIGLVNLNVNPDIQPHAGICQDAPAIGAMATRLVIDKMNQNERGIPASRVTILTEGRWCEGSTLPV
ncbi:LacI family DNA-binding transcriptional regulator [Geminisphaera colitermitum]|uniref:LacI family DNA-binding transcriptional regulator n=1 Tax=Geminisphaera colitermitum TaxID=1148786 RepID=UPI0001964E11|nr:LacI family DNA-binding transcriptional regulator [Geminisphaera colitermitum]